MIPDATDSGKVFDAAKAIVQTLQGLDKTHQQLAIRFASESLGLAASAQHQSSPQLSNPTIPANPPLAAADPVHSTDIKQFTTAKAPKSHQQFAAVVAYFYRYHAPEAHKKDAITAKDLREAVRLASWKGLTKPGMTLNNAKTAGYLDKAERGKFRISTVGENLVAVTLPGNAATGSGMESNGRRKPRKTAKKRKAAGKKKGAKAGS